jgi:hypothetical protein
VWQENIGGRAPAGEANLRFNQGRTNPVKVLPKYCDGRKNVMFCKRNARKERK